MTTFEGVRVKWQSQFDSRKRGQAKDWYSPGEIRFTVQQALWLVRSLGNLRGGNWPPDASNYIDIPGSKSRRNRAPFVTPIEYAAEIEARLEKCGLDGLILEAIECWDKSTESMANYLRMPEWSIRKRRKTALGYVASGPARRWHNTKKRKGETYQDFKKRRKK